MSARNLVVQYHVWTTGQIVTRAEFVTPFPAHLTVDTHRRTILSFLSWLGMNTSAVKNSHHRKLIHLSNRCRVTVTARRPPRADDARLLWRKSAHNTEQTVRSSYPLLSTCCLTAIWDVRYICLELVRDHVSLVIMNKLPDACLHHLMCFEGTVETKRELITSENSKNTHVVTQKRAAYCLLCENSTYDS